MYALSDDVPWAIRFESRERDLRKFWVYEARTRTAAV
jgi:hypothetical protein